MSAKVEQAWAELKKLPPERQEIAAEAILDYAASGPRLALSQEQVAEVERRLSDTHPTFLTLAEVRERFKRSGV